MSDIQSAVLNSVIVVTFIINILTLLSILKNRKAIKIIEKKLKERQE